MELEPSPLASNTITLFTYPFQPYRPIISTLIAIRNRKDSLHKNSTTNDSIASFCQPTLKAGIILNTPKHALFLLKKKSPSAEDSGAVCKERIGI